MIAIPKTDKKRVVIVGCGFAGLTLAKKLRNSNFQVVILNKHNYHQFQPLFYQVASAGIEPSAVCFPLRKIFQHYKDYYIRKAEVISFDSKNNKVNTSLGSLDYDYLVLAHGAKTSFFGLKNLENHSKTMKSVSEALNLRNSILQNFEDALTAKTKEEMEQFMNIVVVGGGPAGVEISGALAEMRNNIRIMVDRYSRVSGYGNIFAIGDIAWMAEEKYPLGHPQVARVAIQHASALSKNLKKLSHNKALQEFRYQNPGSMATIGRNLAVVELPFMKSQGFFAWLIWMFVHLMSIVGVKNKILVFINWLWNYITYDQSLRLIIHPKPEQGKASEVSKSQTHLVQV